MDLLGPSIVDKLELRPKHDCSCREGPEFCHAKTPSTQRQRRPGERVAYHSPHADTFSMYEV
jgi:hypothetical protein